MYLFLFGNWVENTFINFRKKKLKNVKLLPCERVFIVGFRLVIQWNGRQKLIVLSPGIGKRVASESVLIAGRALNF